MNSAMNKNGPNFIGIGMERAGTSWLFTQIAFHPDIWVPPLKELHYFDVIDPKAFYLKHRYRYHFPSRLKQKLAPFLNTENRPEFHKNSYLTYLLWDFLFFTGKMDKSWYSRLFGSTFTNGRTSGEITPAYSNLTPQTIQKILQINPDMKFILITRAPAERIWSGIIHHFRHIEKRDFTSVTEEEIIEYLQKPVSRNRSNIDNILETWKGEVEEKNLFIQPFERISCDPKALIKETYQFLGVDSSFLPPEKFYTKKINDYSHESYKASPKIQEIIEEKINC